MKNTHLNKVNAGNILVLNPDQVSTLVDLVQDQIRTQRVFLRTSEFRSNQNIHLRALTHYRHVKRLLTAKEKEAAREAAREEAEGRENAEIYNMFKS